MQKYKLYRVDAVRTAGIASVLAIIGSVLWLPAAFAWRGKMAEHAGEFAAISEQAGRTFDRWGPPPAWLIAISPLTNGLIVLVSTLITVAIFNWLLRRLGGLRIEARLEE